ncbi:hypothetical protein C8R47DRAFT_481349 [Mycena vitilis]|nr:hypothetical protein C8R47DRAFT_481349 [Mycena vitilis]
MRLLWAQCFLLSPSVPLLTILTVRYIPVEYLPSRHLVHKVIFYIFELCAAHHSRGSGISGTSSGANVVNLACSPHGRCLDINVNNFNLSAPRPVDITCQNVKQEGGGSFPRLQGYLTESPLFTLSSCIRFTAFMYA